MKLVKNIAVVGISLLMVVQTNTPATAAIAQTIQDAQTSEVATYSGETHADEVATGESSKSDSATDSGAFGENKSNSGTTDADTSNKDSQEKDNTQSGTDSDNRGATNNAGENADDAATVDANEDEDDSTAEAAAQAAPATFNNIDDLKAAMDALGDGTVCTVANGIVTSLEAKDAKAIILLSNADAKLYKTARISFNTSGDIDLTVSYSQNGTEYWFQGLGGTGSGNDDDAFVGSFVTGDKAPILNRALFNKYKMTNGDSFKLKFKGAAQGDNLFADKVIGDTSSPSLKVNISLVTSDDKKVAPRIAAPLVGDVDGSLTLDASYEESQPFTTGGTDTSFKNGSSISCAGNAGLVARTVKSGALSLNSLTFSNLKKNSPEFNVTSENSNAGLLFGELCSNATVLLPNGYGAVAGTGSFTSYGNYSGTVSAPNGAAGGLAGRVDNGGMVSISGNEVNLSNLTVTGKYAGGFVGYADGMNLTADNFGAKFIPAKNVGDTNSQCAGGLFGWASFAQDLTFDNGDGFKNVDLSVGGKGFSLKAKSDDKFANHYAGGLIGYLSLANSVTFTGRTDLKSELNSDSGNANYGGVVGRVATLGDAKALTVSDCTVSATSGSGKARYFGGLVGWVGVGISKDLRNPARTGFVVRNANVTCDSPAITRSFGGAVGCVDGSGTVDLGSFKLTTANGLSSDNDNNKSAGGAIGEAWSCSVVQFSGITNIDDAQFKTGDNDSNLGHVGQLVGLQVGALIYATGTGQNGSDDHAGWTLDRGSAVSIDDIASSGEVIRVAGGLDGLISLDETTYNVNIQGTVAESGGALQINDVKDFARIAIAMQTFGRFASGVSGITLDELYKKNITFKSDVNLSGTGLIGFMRDRFQTWLSDDGTNNGLPDTAKLCSYSGTVNGNGHSVTLAIGESYGKRSGNDIDSEDTSEGNGRIYRHDRLGLFSCFAGSVSNIGIKGSIDYRTSVNKTCVGSVAAQIYNAKEVNVRGVSAGVDITCRGSQSDNAISHIGGFFGQISTGKPTINFLTSDTEGNNVTVKASIETRAERNVCGGVIGFIEDSTYATINVGKLAVGGKICAKAANAAQYAVSLPDGGLVAVVSPRSGGGLNLTLNGLVVDNFEIQYPNCNYAGGILGYVWGNTQASFNKDGLKVNDSKITTTNSDAKIQNAGGLVYDASGKWTVDSHGIDMGRYTVERVGSKDGKTGALGLLVCRGGFNRDVLTGGRFDTGTLYLESTASDAITFNAAICKDVNVATFDEWVASTASSDTSSGKHANDILASGVNGVVSLYAANTNGKREVVMDGATCNTWKNKTDYGKSHQTNVNTRYYYNLDYIRDNLPAKDGSINTPGELTLWAAVKYASSDIRPYLYKDGTDITSSLPNTICGDALDLRGYSYYPIDLTDEDLSIAGAAITFHNEEIEKAEVSANNKSTDAATQHLAMHAGLLRNYVVTDPAAGRSKTLKITGTTLSGSIGMMASSNLKGSYIQMASSGALISGDAYGNQASDGSHNYCNVTIGSSDAHVKLDGLKVYNLDQSGAESLPLLINDLGVTKDAQKNLGGRVSLVVSGLDAVNYSNIGQNSNTVATSLFGDFGDSGATQIKARLTDIKIPSKKNKDAIFNHASFFNSFAYRSGSGVAQAIYTFNIDTKKDGAKAGQVTYGKEIDDSDSVYYGKQLWYYDEDKYREDTNLVTDEANDITASLTSPAFGDYLPYVYKTNEGSCHEIMVNQRQEDLLTGCGTYGDPYVIKKASTFEALAGYVNQPTSASEGWRITIAKDQNVMCKRLAASGTEEDASNEVTYVYQNGSWVSDLGTGPVLTNDVMHAYIQSCYIDLQPQGGTLELSNKTFEGLGNVDYPFRGVVTSTKSVTDKKIQVKITGDNKAFQGFIPYSYGSVIRDIDICYSGFEDTITRDNVNREVKYQSPSTFFGGVIGNIVGGDNVIENVRVVSGDNPFSVKADGVCSNLVPIGGVVGAICGGGVVFRGTIAAAFGGSASDYYNNPIIGRVLDGYAYSEDSTVGDNTVEGKTCNYKINMLDTSKTGVISTGNITNVRTGDKVANTTTVSNAQGLLVLSGIIASGAAAGPVNAKTDAGDNTIWAGRLEGTNAYFGRSDSEATTGNGGGYNFGNADYGKVRNADYSHIGKPGDSGAKDDFDTSVKDDTRTPGIWEGKARPENVDTSASSDAVNAPYLVTRYCSNKATMFICAAGCSSIDLQLTGQKYDMTGYGNGYQGLSGRYYTNAAVDTLGDVAYTGKAKIASYSRDRLIPWVANIDGHGTTISANMDVREYANDDFNTLGVGALFSTVIFASPDLTNGGDVSLQNFTIANSTIKHELSTANTSSDNYFKYMGVGGIAGVAAGQTAGVTEGERTGNRGQVVLNKVKVTGAGNEGTNISGPATAGGYFGESGAFGRVGQVVGTGSVESNYMLASRQLNGKKLSFKFVDCSYDAISVTGGFHTGGFVGSIDSLCEYNVSKTDPGNYSNRGNAEQDASTLASNLVVVDGNVDNDFVTGKNSAISTTGEVGSFGGMGGLFGYSSDPISINVDPDGNSGGYKTVKILDVNVAGNAIAQGAGGIVGCVKAGDRGGVHIYGVEVASSNRATTDGGASINQSCTVIGTTYENYTEANWNVREDQKNAAKWAGGIIGKLSSNKRSIISNAKVGNIYLQSREGDAGIIGSLDGCELSSDNVTVKGIWVRGDCSGAYSGIAEENSKLTVKNSRFADNVFGATPAWWNSGLGNLSGGFCGDARGTFRLNNLLFKNLIFKDAAHQGILTGNGDPGDVAGFYAAGIEVRLSGDCPTDILHTGGNAGGVTAMNKKSFVSFSNYQGNAKKTNDSLFGGPAQADPYVTTSPQSTSIVYERQQSGTATKIVGSSLYGDGAILSGVTLASGSTGSMAQKIVEDGVNDNKTTDDGSFVYRNTNGIDGDGNTSRLGSFNAASVSTFNENNGDKQQLTDNIPVFLINGGADGEVEKYLNIVTNGGYSEAVNCNGTREDSVTASTDLYKVQDGKLVKAEDGDTSTSIMAEKSGKSGMHFVVSPGYDNGKGQVTLITVTFKAGDGMEHKVMFPVIVRRLLKTTFSATLKNGSSFYDDAFTGTKNADGSYQRLLASYGEVVSGQLTFRYNHDENGKTEYGWDTYLAAGGGMGPVQKTLTFDNDSSKAFPKGTQFTLTDKSTGLAYIYTAGDGGVTSISLADFRTSSDAAYQGKWMSELMGVKADDQSGAKNWVECEEKDATVKSADGKFYRPAKTTDTEPKYTLTCEKSGDKKEISPREDFYLEIYIPTSGKDGTASGINGSLAANIACDKSDIKFDNVKAVIKNNDETSDKFVADNHSNTPSTYSFVGGYAQTLTDRSTDGSGAKEPEKPTDGTAGRILHVKVEDKIDFDKAQISTTSDALHYRLGMSLSQFKDNTLDSSSAFPAGTTGTAYFYVYRMEGENKVFYQSDGKGGLTKAGSSEVSAGSASWGNNEQSWTLTPAFDLAAVRQDEKDSQTGTGTFCIETRMDLHLSEEAYKAAIATSKNQTADGSYTSLGYRGTLATGDADNLNSSSLVTSITGLTKYYRQDTGVSLIGLTADATDRLGINVDDLNNSGDGNIGATGVYDLTRLTGGSDIIDDADQVRYTIRLEQRQDDGSYAVVDPSKYLSSLAVNKFGTLTAVGNAYTVVDAKTGGSFATKDANSNKFKLNIQLKVNTGVRDFANYRLVLTAQLYKDGTVVDTPWNKNKINASTDAGAHSDYITYTLTRVNVKGITGSTTS